MAIDASGTLLKHSFLTFCCDNRAVVDVINSGTTRDLDKLVILHAITLLALRHNIQLYSLHYPGKLDTVADYLSRLQAGADFLLSTHLMEVPTLLCISALTSM